MNRASIMCAAVAIGCFAMLSSAVASPPVYGLKVTGGVVDHQVFQRDADNAASFTVRGIAYPYEACDVQWRVRRRNTTVAGFGWQAAQWRSDGAWEAVVDALPTGGPYTIAFRLINDAQQEIARIDVNNVLVGDLWFLGGQSNMDGCGALADAERASEMVHAFTLADEWMVAEDPLHLTSEGAYAMYRTSYASPTRRNPVEYKTRDALEPRAYGAGLGVPFGKMVYRETNVPIGLIVGSLGGSTMAQWSPDIVDRQEHSLYWIMIKRINDLGGRIAGMLWWQGESDAYAAAGYENRFTRFIASVRRDLGRPDLPFYAVQLSHGSVGSGSTMEPWFIVQDAQRRVMQQLEHGGIVSSMDLPLQDAHLTTEGYKRVGRRLAMRVLRDVYGLSQYHPGPRLDRIDFFKSMHGDGIRLTFTGVNGRLIAPTRVSGFSVRREDATNERLVVIRQELDPDDPHAVLLHLLFDLSDHGPLFLWYGHGAETFCNVTDEADMALTMFGPVAIPYGDAGSAAGQ